MPSWLIIIIIQLAVKFGLPQLIKLFPKLPVEVVQIVNDLLAKLADHKEEKVSMKKEAVVKIKECLGVACPTDIKGE